jgi:hypothetical protein
MAAIEDFLADAKRRMDRSIEATRLADLAVLSDARAT